VKNLGFQALALVAGLAVSPSVLAEGMTKTQYQAAEQGLTADFKAGKASCDQLSGNAKDICVAEAKGREKVAKAELEVQYQPTPKHRNDLLVARADAAYMVAIERCDDLSGNAKDVCVKEAKAAKVHATSEATVKMETYKAETKANEASAKANSKAVATESEARHDATSDKQSADYAVAKERCDVLAGDAKTACVDDAKARYSQR
jgi:hypothetical protein